MSIYSSEYKRKLTTPQKAVQVIKTGDTVTHGLTTAEPPALLGAIADRLRSEDLKKIKLYTMLPQETATKTVLSPDISDCLETYTLFVSGSSRNMVSVGLSYFVPNYFHQIP
ncbi:MAG: 4-hydroxybutyrate--acetyl-CoA CoA transferase, partial [Chloroflexi bacterium]|nr:4-hydroxybutyrate--acetyl-CoA CoA transferase [Chloroflexota bacterium]